MGSLGWVCFCVWGLVNCLIAYRLLRRPGRFGESEGSPVSFPSADEVLSARQGDTGLRVW
jgi:hypothetical protein